MTFEPRSGAHAIVEAVFGLQLARSLTPTEIEKAVAAHDMWRTELPRLSRMNVVQVVLGDSPVPPGAVPAGGVVFDSLKRDGNPEWRLRLEGNSFLVNCLAYDTWTAVWAKAEKLLAQSMSAAGVATEPLGAILLEYIDAFDWTGVGDQYDLDELLDPKSRFVPPTVRNRGHLWHLHQGWFRSDGIPVPGRLLERIHADGVDEQNRPTVKIDTLLRIDCQPPATIQRDEVAKIFSYLHDLNKGLLRDHITSKMAQRIKLDG